MKWPDKMFKFFLDKDVFFSFCASLLFLLCSKEHWVYVDF